MSKAWAVQGAIIAGSSNDFVPTRFQQFYECSRKLFQQSLWATAETLRR